MNAKKLFLFLSLNAFTIFAFSQDQPEGPHFLIKGESGVENFPLLSTSADVYITGPIANVTVTQSYVNEGTQPIEAIYVFPASTRAAVYHMEMHIGDRILKAEIQEKKKAQEIYDKAKEEGKRASLLQQHKPNVFQMNVANIMPGDRIDVLNELCGVFNPGRSAI